MRSRILVLLLSAILLSGCWWEGPVFYPPDATAVQPITVGRYEARTGNPGDKPDRGRLDRLPNGTWADGKDAKVGYFFARLDGTPRTFGSSS